MSSGLHISFNSTMIDAKGDDEMIFPEEGFSHAKADKVHKNMMGKTSKGKTKFKLLKIDGKIIIPKDLKEKIVKLISENFFEEKDHFDFLNNKTPDLLKEQLDYILRFSDTDNNIRPVSLDSQATNGKDNFQAEKISDTLSTCSSRQFERDSEHFKKLLLQFLTNFGISSKLLYSGGFSKYSDEYDLLFNPIKYNTNDWFSLYQEKKPHLSDSPFFSVIEDTEDAKHERDKKDKYLFKIYAEQISKCHFLNSTSKLSEILFPTGVDSVSEFTEHIKSEEFVRNLPLSRQQFINTLKIVREQLIKRVTQK